MRRKIPKTLSGIETSHTARTLSMYLSRKIPKTLSGIETVILTIQNLKIGKAGKYLKPYQGLKPDNVNMSYFSESRKIPKTLSGIET